MADKNVCPTGRPRTRRTRRGTILIVTILLVFALAGIAITICQAMRVEVIASGNHAASLQASAVARGAEHYLLGMLAENGTDLTSLTEDQFAAVQVGEGYFWVIRPDYGDSGEAAFGLTDEAAKLNINVASFDHLLLLPRMTDQFAASIVDWRDEDEGITPSGGESESYPDYFCKNAPFETVEELLLVNGATADLIYGQTGTTASANRSTPSASSSLSTVADVWYENGIFDLLTVFSSEPGTAPDGTPRVNLADTRSREQLRQLMRTQLGNTRGDEVVNLLGNRPVRDIFDMYFLARMNSDELAKVADYISTTTGTQNNAVKGRINVNTAPREVLLTLEGLDSTDVDKLVNQRRSLSTTQQNTVAWVPEALGQKAVGLGNRVTGRSYQYTADIVAVSGNGRAFRRVRIVIDMSSQTPVIVYRRDLSDRGWPMDAQILASLRAGQGPGSWASSTNSGAVLP